SSARPAASLLAPQPAGGAVTTASASTIHPLRFDEDSSILWNLDSEAKPRTSSLSPLIVSEGHRNLQIQPEAPAARTAEQSQTKAAATLLWNLDNGDLDRVPMLSAKVPSPAGEQLEIVTN